MIKALSRYFLRKALSGMVHPGGSRFVFSLLPRTKYDYASEVGAGTGSSVIMGPVQWLQRAFNEADPEVMRRTEDEPKIAADHPLAALLRRPNPFYSGDHLYAATVFSWCLFGNAYWIKIRNAAGKPVELWWAPNGAIRPRWPDDGSKFVEYYEYTPGRGRKERLEIGDVVHFRHGIDPENTRLGLSPLRSVMREAWTDDEASNHVGSILRNGGVPGVVISPKEGAALPMDVDLMKKYVMETFSGDRKGEPFVAAAPTDVSQFGWSPQQLDLSSVRDVAEERVCACLGIAAAVVGLGTGLQTTRVGATMREMVRLSWTCGVIPLQRSLAEEVTRSLLPDFGGGEGEYVEFDTRDIQALQEDVSELYKRAQIGLGSGFQTVAEAKRMVGLTPGPGDDVYLRSIAVVEVPAGGKDLLPLAKHLTNGQVKADDHLDPAVRRALAQAPKRKPTRAAVGAMRSLDRLGARLSEAFELRVGGWLAEIGAEADRAAAGILGSKALDDEMDAEEILDGMRWEKLLASGRRLYDAHYAATLKETFGGMNAAFNLQTDLPDPAALRGLEEGGRRFGLLDMRGSSREKLFTILSEGREEGLGADALARRIRDTVGAGPWSDPSIRARMVARTETKYAQNVSVAEYAKAAGAPRVMVFDARLGPTDEECEQLDGALVPADEAASLAAAEHPNGTRSFTPWFEED